MTQSAFGFSTRAVWSGQEPCAATGATIVPVYQSVTFTLPAIGATRGYDYSRTVNPTRSAVERQLAVIEGAAYCSAFASGMAAVAGATSLLSAGDHIVATCDIYGGTHRLFTQVLARYGITTTFVDMTDLDAVRRAVRPDTRLLWIETPKKSDPQALRHRGNRACDKPADTIVAVDNTFASPFLQQPLISVPTWSCIRRRSISAGTATRSAVRSTNNREISQAVAYHQNAVGAVPGPWDAYLTLRGAKTSRASDEAQSRNAGNRRTLGGARRYRRGLLSRLTGAPPARACEAPDAELRRGGFIRARGGTERAAAIRPRPRSSTWRSHWAALNR